MHPGINNVGIAPKRHCEARRAQQANTKKKTDRNDSFAQGLHKVLDIELVAEVYATRDLENG